MFLNGYDTTAGSKNKIKDSIATTLKGLSTMDQLPKVSKKGVYAINHANGNDLSVFVYPLSLTDYKRENITVVDQRPYFNKSGSVVNDAEYSMIELAAMLQQDLQKGEMTLIKQTRPLVARTVSRAVGELISKEAGLNDSQRMTVQIILAHYYFCLTENINSNWVFPANNLVSQTVIADSIVISEIIDHCGFINTLPLLLKALKTHPSLMSLDRLDIVGLITYFTRIWMVLSGFRQILAAAAEMPTYLIAMCYATVTHRIYQKTKLGEYLDPKFNKGVDNFIKQVGYYKASA